MVTHSFMLVSIRSYSRNPLRIVIITILIRSEWDTQSRDLWPPNVVELPLSRCDRDHEPAWANSSYLLLWNSYPPRSGPPLKVICTGWGLRVIELLNRNHNQHSWSGGIPIYNVAMGDSFAHHLHYTPSSIELVFQYQSLWRRSITGWKIGTGHPLNLIKKMP